MPGYGESTYFKKNEQVAKRKARESTYFNNEQEAKRKDKESTDFKTSSPMGNGPSPESQLMF